MPLSRSRLGAVHRAQEVEEHLEHGRRDGGVGGERERADAVVVAVHVVMVMMTVPLLA